jgi:NAD(P)-dependent dehydrogenase (short-subunit alcohol dehydrogenase family)
MTRTYVVTGAASGIGAATRARLLADGHRVIGVDLHDTDVIADLSNPHDRRTAAEAAVAAADGTVDAVIACAGIAAPNERTIAVNFFGVTEFLDAIRPTLANAPAPSAAVVSSMASLQPNLAELVDACLAGDEPLALRIGQSLAEQGRQTGYLNYTSSKRALSRWVRRESITHGWAGARIPLNAVAPGTVLTPMTADLLASPETTAQVDRAVPMPLNYHQRPETVADLLAWLTGEPNTHCTGQTIYCDGGADATLRGDDIWSWND